MSNLTSEELRRPSYAKINAKLEGVVAPDCPDHTAEEWLKIMQDKALEQDAKLRWRQIKDDPEINHHQVKALLGVYAKYERLLIPNVIKAMQKEKKAQEKTSLKEVSVRTLAELPVEKPIEKPIATPVENPAETSAEVPTEALAETWKPIKHFRKLLKVAQRTRIPDGIVRLAARTEKLDEIAILLRKGLVSPEEVMLAMLKPATRLNVRESSKSKKLKRSEKSLARMIAPKKQIVANEPNFLTIWQFSDAKLECPIKMAEIEVLSNWTKDGGEISIESVLRGLGPEYRIKEIEVWHDRIVSRCIRRNACGNKEVLPIWQSEIVGEFAFRAALGKKILFTVVKFLPENSRNIFINHDYDYIAFSQEDQAGQIETRILAERHAIGIP